MESVREKDWFEQMNSGSHNQHQPSEWTRECLGEVRLASLAEALEKVEIKLKMSRGRYKNACNGKQMKMQPSLLPHAASTSAPRAQGQHRTALREEGLGQLGRHVPLPEGFLPVLQSCHTYWYDIFPSRFP